MKPCPFCGSNNIAQWSNYGYDCMRCRDCMAMGPKVSWNVNRAWKRAEELWENRKETFNPMPENGVR